MVQALEWNLNDTKQIFPTRVTGSKMYTREWSGLFSQTLSHNNVMLIIIIITLALREIHCSVASGHVQIYYNNIQYTIHVLSCIIIYYAT